MVETVDGSMEKCAAALRAIGHGNPAQRPSPGQVLLCASLLTRQAAIAAMELLGRRVWFACFDADENVTNILNDWLKSVLPKKMASRNTLISLLLLFLGVLKGSSSLAEAYSRTPCPDCSGLRVLLTAPEPAAELLMVWEDPKHSPVMEYMTHNPDRDYFRRVDGSLISSADPDELAVNSAIRARFIHSHSLTMMSNSYGSAKVGDALMAASVFDEPQCQWPYNSVLTIQLRTVEYEVMFFHVKSIVENENYNLQCGTNTGTSDLRPKFDNIAPEVFTNNSGAVIALKSPPALLSYNGDLPSNGILFGSVLVSQATPILSLYNKVLSGALSPQNALRKTDAILGDIR